MSVQGGPLHPIHIVSSSELIENGGKFGLRGRLAIRVYGFTTEARAVYGDRAMPVYVVSDEELASGDFVVKDSPAQPVIPLAVIGGERAVEGNTAVPVYLVGGSL